MLINAEKKLTQKTNFSFVLEVNLNMLKKMRVKLIGSLNSGSCNDIISII